MIVLDNYNDYLVGSLYINTSEVLATEQIEAFINEVENDILTKLLGENVYAQVIAGTYNIDDLINGAPNGVYQYEGKSYFFEGLKKMIASFVYYKYQIFILTGNSAAGTIQSNMQNSTPLIDSTKLRYAYNIGVDLYRAAYNYTNRNAADYEGVETTQINKINAFYF
jgi:hypothetical protein